MSAHTPGPWRIAGKGTIRRGDTDWIASVSWRNRAANAALIETAPDLLAACQSAEDFIATIDSPAAHAIYEQLHAAIVRATSKEAQGNG